MLATFFLFYSVQFLDTERFVAGYNVKLWQESGQHRTLDLSYLEALGPSAFDAIGEVARTGPNPGDGADARNFLLNARTDAENSLSKTPWASFQLRARRYQGRLATTAL